MLSHKISKIIWVITAISLAPLTSSTAATSKESGSGAILSISKTKNITTDSTIKISGSHFDETVGIYLAMCKKVAISKLPSPCGGGMDQSGVSGSSIWVSSNPPPYGKGLAIPFKAGGRFNFSIQVSPMIGKFDCRKIRCAIYARADHTRSNDRSYDISIPIRFKK